MKSFRKQGFLLLLVFAILALGIHFHSHAQRQDQSNATCNLCQLSHVSFEVASTTADVVEQVDTPLEAPEPVNFTTQSLAIRLPGRAPPEV